MPTLTTFNKKPPFPQTQSVLNMLERAGVPDDTRWCALLLYLREMKDFMHYTDNQKLRIQTLLTKALERRDFSEDRLQKTLEEYKSVTIDPYKRKIEDMLRETACIVDNFQELLQSRYGSIQDLEKEAITAVESDLDGPDLLSRLRGAFNNVKTLLENDMRSLERLADCDPLTDIGNRRAFDAFMAEAVERWSTEGRPLALAMFDIDNFKHFNDEHGHRIGDQVLRLVARCLADSGRPLAEQGNQVLAARYGGEEFALAVSGPDAQSLPELTEKIRIAIRDYHFIIRDGEGTVIQNALRITVSAGVAICVPEWADKPLETLVDSADHALYAAKRSGRDRTMRADPTAKNGYKPVQGKDFITRPESGVQS